MKVPKVPVAATFAGLAALLAVVAAALFFGPAEQAKSYTLVWTMPKDDPRFCNERDWVRHELMARVQYNEIDATSQVKGGGWQLETPLHDNAVLVYSDMRGTNIEPIRQYMRALRAAGFRFSCIHFSDEFYKADYSVYDYCQSIIRGGHAHPMFKMERNILQIPLGSFHFIILAITSTAPDSLRPNEQLFPSRVFPTRALLRRIIVKVYFVAYH
jgi:hypothetical protein